jgi:hypothetical protein
VSLSKTTGGSSTAKCEASWQECQPIALGPLGPLDGTVGFFDFSPKLLSPERYAIAQNSEVTFQRTSASSTLSFEVAEVHKG